MSELNAVAANEAFDELMVVEFGDEATQSAGKFFADMGAIVVKVEPPGGCGARHHGPFRDDVEDPNGCLYFWANNTGKSSVTIDVTTAAGRAALSGLVGRADVLLEDAPPGTMADLGLAYEDLAARNERLVMTSVTPFGADGPMADWLGSDIVTMAMGGAMWNLGYDDPESPPLLPQGDLSFHVAGLWASIATLAALTARIETGKGQHVDISTHEAVAFLVHCYNTVGYEYQGTVMHRHDYVPTVMAGDGRRVLPQILNLAPQKWLEFRDWLLDQGVGEALSGMDVATLEDNMDLVRDAIGEIAATMPASELVVIGQSFGMTWAAVNAPEELIDNEQLRHRGFFVDLAHPELDTSYTYGGPAAIWSEGSPGLRRRAPLLGEHNDEWGIS